MLRTRVLLAYWNNVYHFTLHRYFFLYAEVSREIHVKKKLVLSKIVNIYI